MASRKFASSYSKRRSSQSNCRTRIPGLAFAKRSNHEHLRRTGNLGRKIASQIKQRTINGRTRNSLALLVFFANSRRAGFQRTGSRAASRTFNERNFDAQCCRLARTRLSLSNAFSLGFLPARESSNVTYTYIHTYRIRACLLLE